MDALKPLALLLMVLGAINWGIIGLFEENVVANVFGTGTFTDVVYIAIGLAGLVYVPRLLEHLPGTAGGPHPRGV